MLHHFVSPEQMAALAQIMRGEEKEYFAELITSLHSRLESMPRIYDQDGKGDDATAYLHYFKGGADWYITERDTSEEQLQAFGLACIQCEELGYISITELIRCNVELDLHFTPKTLKQIKQERK